MPFSVRRLLWPKSLGGKAVSVAAFAIALLVGLYAAAAFLSSKRLADAWIRREELGLTSDFEMLLGPYVHPDKNAALPLNEASRIADQFVDAARAKHQIDSDDNENAGYYAEFEALRNDAEYERLLTDADRRPEYRSCSDFVRPFSIANINLNLISERRSLTRAEYALAMQLTSTARREDAVRRLLRLLRIARKWEGKEPFQIMALLNIALRTQPISGLNEILRRGGPLSKELHAEIDSEAAALEKAVDALPWAFQTETIFISDSFESEPMSRLPVGSLVANEGKILLLRLADQVHEFCTKPFPSANREWLRLESEVGIIRDSWLSGRIGLGAESVVKSGSATQQAFVRSTARARCLRIVNAWAARGDFRLELEKLDLPEASLIDPFNEKPFRVKQTPDGPIVYSVAENLLDDGGAVGSPATDVGLGPVIKGPGSK